ncbi:RHS repeat-associated core domain containing protein [Nitzschia inconspicua]|uniref:RHS repeat-associated core domain containing protein n=1 Tax=Nitzschia inconspicua TaxID=303405 RepID=A0A9K3PQN6_9STRA|nr:RHS repeat-associated core domain containing protein [Nitzschia inconspicua]
MLPSGSTNCKTLRLNNNDLSGDVPPSSFRQLKVMGKPFGIAAHVCQSGEWKETIETNQNGAIFVSKQPTTPSRYRRDDCHGGGLARCDSLALARRDADDTESNNSEEYDLDDPNTNTSVVSLELLTVVDDNDSDEKTRIQQFCGKRLIGCWACGLVLIILAIVLPLTLNKDRNREDVGLSDGSTDIGFVSDNANINVAYDVLRPIVSNPEALLDPSTPEGQAFWDVESNGETNPFHIQQQYALQMLYYSTAGESWVFNHGWQSYSQQRGTRKRSLADRSLCQWSGITICRYLGEDRYAVAGLDLDFNNISGSLPEDLCLLDRLETLRVANNQLKGTIPSCLASNAFQVLEVQGNKGLDISAVSDPSFCEYDWKEFIADCSMTCDCCTSCVQ